MKIRNMNIRLFFIFAVLCVLASCSDSDNALDAPLAITQADAVYDAAGGEGKVTISSPYGINSISISDSWCVATQEGDNSVHLNVAANPLMETRSAVVTITDNNGGEAHLSISQGGSLYSLNENKAFNFGYQDSTLTVKIASHNVDADLKASADWLSARQEGENIVVNVSANNSGTWRAGTVYCQIGGINRDSIVVVQAEEKDIYGDYYMVGEPYNASQTYPSVTRLSIVRGDSANQVKINWTDTGFSCDYPFAADSLVLKIWANVYHPLGYRRFTISDFMVGGDIDAMSGVYLLMLSDNGYANGGFRTNQENLSTDAYLSAIGNQVVWRLRSNSSLPGVEFNGIFIYDDYESLYTSGGVFIRARNVYMIPANKYTPTAE